MTKDFRTEFQTLPPVCKYMAGMIPPRSKTILEPTPGLGNIVKELSDYEVTAPADFFLLDRDQRFDAIVMNPPFTSKTAFLENAPKDFAAKKMSFGYYVLTECMKMTDNIIALLPEYTMTNSDIRRRFIWDFGLKSYTPLPRKTFQYARTQTVVIELQRDYKGDCIYKRFEF